MTAVLFVFIFVGCTPDAPLDSTRQMEQKNADSACDSTINEDLNTSFNTPHPITSVNLTVMVSIMNVLVFSDVVGNPLAHFLCAILSSTLNLNLGGAHIGVERGIHSLAHKRTLVVKTKMLEKHGG